MIFPEYQLEFHTLAVHGQLDNKKSPFDNEMDIIVTQVELKPTDEKKISTIHNQPNQNADKSPTIAGMSFGGMNLQGCTVNFNFK